MKPIRIIKPLPPKEAKVAELDAKKKAGETEKEWRERMEAKMDLLLSRWPK
jgi:hypothetical protein